MSVVASELTAGLHGDASPPRPSGAILTIANGVTLGRIAATPFFLYLLVRHPTGWSTWTPWFFLCLTDTVDGKIARRRGVTTSGAFLDPLADKVLVLGCMVTLVAVGRLWVVPVVLIAAREAWMSVHRSFLAKQGVSVPANTVAKAKTWAQCVGAGLTMFPPTARHPLAYGGAVWISVALTLGTGAHYAITGRRLVAALPTKA